jgi:hydrogenase/urease accessory protein HupE
VTRKKILARFAGFAIAVVGASTASAHNPGLSSMNVEVREREIRVIQTFSERDISGLAAVPADLAAGSVRVEFDGKAATPRSAITATDASHDVEFELTFSRPEKVHAITFSALLLKDLPSAHRQAFTVRDPNGREVLSLLLSPLDDTADVVLEKTDGRETRTDRFLGFLRLGIFHILTGYDHLLFLFGLLVMCRSGRAAALFITSFTVAHSLTLALSTFGLVSLPSRFVEAAIAASILYVGIENLIRHDQPTLWRALLAFAFGLVHGLGFAAVLREMGVANSGSAAVIPLVAFNSGVELGQLGVAAIILPLVWLLRRNESTRRIGLPACSVAVAISGGYWLLDRTFF